MPTHDEKPWWELEGRPPPWDAHFDDEAERLETGAYEVDHPEGTA